MYDAIYRRFLMPWHHAMRGRKAIEYWNLARESQWLSQETLQARQLEALHQLLQHAQQTTEYYATVCDTHQLSPKLSSLSELVKFPLLSRQTIRHQPTQLRSRLYPQAIHKATGGSSGEPLQFALCGDSNDRRTAMMYRGYEWAGAPPGTRSLLLWGSHLGKPQAPWRRWKQWLHQRFENQSLVSCFESSTEDQFRHHAQLMHWKPKVVIAYTNPLYEFAKFVRERGLRIPKLHSLIVGAEKLHPFQRALIEEVFQAPVFETYGSREFMLIGAECPEHSGLHLSQENLLVEVVDDDGNPTPDGQIGNVVVTDLYNYAMPFVRYVTGDLARAGETRCRCGRGLPLLHEIVGRKLDILTTVDGRRIPGEVFPHLVKDFPMIRRFQVEQARLDEITLRLECEAGYDHSLEAQLLQSIQEILGQQTQLRVEHVPSIPLTRAGKLRVVVNHLSSSEYACRN